MWIVDASVIIALGRQDALNLLTNVESIAVPPQIREEVTQEPEATTLSTFVASADVHLESPPTDILEDARALLNDEQITGDAAVIASVILADNEDAPIGVVSDDQRIRRVATGLGADVTGTIGVIVDAVRQQQITATAAKDLVRDIDRRGFHMTGELRDAADELIDAAVNET